MLERRHSWGADRHDEVWSGVLHLDRLRAHGVAPSSARNPTLSVCRHSCDAQSLAVRDDQLSEGIKVRLVGDKAVKAVTLVALGDDVCRVCGVAGE